MMRTKELKPPPPSPSFGSSPPGSLTSERGYEVVDVAGLDGCSSCGLPKGIYRGLGSSIDLFPKKSQLNPSKIVI